MLMLSRKAGTSLASTSYLAIRAPPLRPGLQAAKQLSTSIPNFRREQEKLPRGHVRPQRRRPDSRPVYQNDQYDPPDLDASPSGLLSIPHRPVIIPPDPRGVLKDDHAARDLLGHETLVIVRQLEMLNVFMGFEQANRYAICTPDGENVGFMAEEERSFISTISRQALRTHRPFRSVIMDRNGTPVLWIQRPFAFINSRIFVHASEEGNQLVGEAQQQWHPWRRRYNLFQARDGETFTQFSKIDSGLLAWDFWLKDKDDRLVASINRNFRGIGREIFTDTGQYVIRFDSAGTELALEPGSEVSLQGQSLILPGVGEGGLTLDQRAMALATAVSIDFDYFSRHSGSGGMGMPFFMWGGGDGGSDINRSGSTSEVPEGPAGAAGVGAGAAGTMSGMTEDQQIYGTPPPHPATADRGWNDMPQEGMDGKYEDEGWVEGEELKDPWSQGSGSDEGLFGGGGDGGGGDWGDWS